jgi:hypothetical protein
MLALIDDLLCPGTCALTRDSATGTVSRMTYQA